MEYIDQILNSFKNTFNYVSAHEEYPDKPGIYAFKLDNNVDLKQFKNHMKIIYIGIAKKSIRDRDLMGHCCTGQTGRSTLRRSLGAILKTDLDLIARSRNGTNTSKAINNYIFVPDGDQRLTDWIRNNLEIGYWIAPIGMSYQDLRKLEDDVCKIVTPALDLDPRTRKFNSFADELKYLRQLCKDEALKSMR